MNNIIKFPLVFLSMILMISCNPTNLTPTTIVPTMDPIGEEFQSGFERGNLIVKKIKEYYHSKNEYPRSLGDLIPKYLPELPLSITGQPFEYRFLEPCVVQGGLKKIGCSNYSLCIRVIRKINSGCCFNSGPEEWECGPYKIYHSGEEP